MNTKTQLQTLCEESLVNHIEVMRKQVQTASYIAGRIALTGEITVIYAAPNTGKTLLTLKLVSQTINSDSTNKKVFYVNLDDNLEGLIEKAEIAESYGFEILGPQNFPRKPVVKLETIMDKLIEEDSAKETVLILDTLKKFTDINKKSSSNEFFIMCRRFTSAGGTLIGLAHTNKNKGEDDKYIHAGVSDSLEECDCAYILSKTGKSETFEGTLHTVSFENIKARGAVLMTAEYQYERPKDGNYRRLFNSVKQLNQEEIDKLKDERALSIEKQKDASIIADIKNVLKQSGDLINKEVLEALKDKHPRRKINACLERWSLPENEHGEWIIERGLNNSKIFKLKAQTNNS